MFENKRADPDTLMDLEEHTYQDVGLKLVWSMDATMDEWMWWSWLVMDGRDILPTSLSMSYG